MIIDESGAFGSGGGKEGGGFLSKIPGLNRIFGGSGGSGGGGKGFSSFLGGAGSLFSSGLFAGARPGDFSVPTGDGRATTASALGTSWRVGNIAASGALVAAGTLGVISGIREGGAGGAVGAVGSALGVASAIPWPQQPFLQAAAMVAGFVKSIIGGGSKESFDKEQASTLNARPSNAIVTV